MCWCKCGRPKYEGGLPRAADGKVDYRQDFFDRPAFLTVSGQLQARPRRLAFACAALAGRGRQRSGLHGPPSSRQTAPARCCSMCSGRCVGIAESVRKSLAQEGAASRGPSGLLCTDE